MGNRELFQQVKDLSLPIGKYALFGSAPIGVRELRDCQDIDIIVTEDLWQDCQKKNWGLKTLSIDGHSFQCLCNAEVELWKDWSPGQWNINELIADAEIIHGLPFVKLDQVLEWKRLKGREKDLKDIEIIERFLQTQ